MAVGRVQELVPRSADGRKYDAVAGVGAGVCAEDEACGARGLQPDVTYAIDSSKFL